MAHRRLSLVALLLTAALLVAAAAIKWLPLSAFAAPRVLQIEPADGARDILPTSPITITFSAPMNRDATQAALRVAPRVAGAWTWRDNQTLVFTPRAALPISRTLAVQISQDARSWLGRALTKETRARFTTLAYPRVVASTPAPEAQFIYIPRQVALTFDRAMNADALRAQLTITPTLANQTLSVNARTLTVGGFFQPRTRYRLTVNAAAMDDAYDIPLERDFVWSFTIAEQYPNFSILQRARVLQFSPSEPLVVPTQFTNVSRLDIFVSPISAQEFDRNANAPFESWYAFQPATAPAQTQHVVTNAALDQYMTRDISLDALPDGTYFLFITTPEGVFDARLLQVK